MSFCVSRTFRMLNNLKNRRLKAAFFFCVNGLAGFKEAIEDVYGGIF